jgi:polyisoprenoid-binding protein YceI
MSATAIETTGTTTWTLDAAHSSVGFAVKHLMIANVRGNFSDFSGTVSIEGDDYSTAQVQAEIDTASITTRNEQRDAHLRSADFFDAGNEPKMTFRSTKVVMSSETDLAITGDLTIRGTTKPVILAVTIEGQGKDPWGGERTAFTAETKIRRSEFGLTWNQVLETGGLAVGDEIRITIEGELVRQA